MDNNKEWTVRTVTSLRNVFGSLHYKREPTGGPKNPQNVWNSTKGWARIRKKCELKDRSSISESSEYSKGGKVHDDLETDDTDEEENAST